MQKNVASQYVTVAAIDVTTGLLKTGDASNITLYYNGDNGGVTVFSTGSGHPSEDDSTNSKGTYTIAATQAETNYNRIRISGKSSTSNVQIIPYEIVTTPANFGLQSIDSNGRLDIIKVNGTSQTARDLGLALPAAGPGAAGGLLISAAGIAGATLDTELGRLDAAVSSRMATFSLPTNFASLGISAGGHISNVDTLTTYTNDTPQSGDGYARIGANGAGLTALGDARIAHLDADVSSRSTLTQTQVTGGAYAINSSSFAFNTALDFTSTQKSSLGTAVGTAQTGDSYARLGAPAGASVSADIASVKSDTATILTDVNAGAGAIYTRLGAPAGASMSADIAAVKASVGTPQQANAAVTLPSIPANWITSAGITAGALNGKGDWLGSSSYPANFGSLAISSGGSVTVGGYNVGQDPAALVFAQVIETGMTMLQAQRLQSAAAGGDLSGAATSTVTIKGAGVPGTTRVSALVDGAGNRTSVTLTL